MSISSLKMYFLWHQQANDNIYLTVINVHVLFQEYKDQFNDDIMNMIYSVYQDEYSQVGSNHLCRIGQCSEEKLLWSWITCER